MKAARKRQIKQRGVLLATGGLLLGLSVLFVFRLLGIFHLTYGQWSLVLAVTLLLQASLLLALRLEWNERRRMAELARTDFLTELPNRRYFEDVLRSELNRIRRYGGRCSLAMIDVDDFKEYNDMFGHMAGDAVLRELSAALRGELRTTDVLARYGGEEFALVLVNAGGEDARRAVERMRAVVDEQAFANERELSSGGITVSAGIACCVDEPMDFGVLVERADAALYRAKREGKNRLTVLNGRAAVSAA